MVSTLSVPYTNWNFSKELKDQNMKSWFKWIKTIGLIKTSWRFWKRKMRIIWYKTSKVWEKESRYWVASRISRFYLTLISKKSENPKLKETVFKMVFLYKLWKKSIALKNKKRYKNWNRVSRINCREGTSITP